jgi:hypothetical protein
LIECYVFKQALETKLLDLWTFTVLKEHIQQKDVLRE